MMTLRTPLLVLIPLFACAACSDPTDPEGVDDSPYAAVIRADDPVAYWRFEEVSGTVTRDGSGNDNDAEYIGDPVLGTSITGAETGRAVTFQNELDGVVSESNDWSDMTSFSVEAWVVPQADIAPGEMIIVDKAETWNLFVDSDGLPAIQFPGGTHKAAGAAPLEVGRAYYLAGTQSNGSFKLYVNGVLVSEFTSSRLIDVRDNPVFVGRGLTSGTKDFVGLIDEVAIYDRVLSATDIMRHYVAGGGDAVTAPVPAVVVDSGFVDAVLEDDPVVFWRFDETSGTVVADASGHARSGRYLGFPRLWQPFAGASTGRAVGLRASADGVTSNSNAWSNMVSFTAEAWVIPQASVAPREMIIIDKAETWNLYVDSDGHPAIGFPGGVRKARGPVPLQVGQTYHLAGTQTNGTFRMYVNGVMVQEYSSTQLIDVRDRPVFVGRGLTPFTHDFVGLISEAVIYDRVLTDADILRHYTRGRLP